MISEQEARRTLIWIAVLCFGSGILVVAAAWAVLTERNWLAAGFCAAGLIVWLVARRVALRPLPQVVDDLRAEEDRDE